ncbi:tripartite tricarboxylate transporter substrate-binding protein [Pigmentiphaga humi]|nr:tripartite tricarboxylate transporter substrate-binding protein [Pigmentiphaga humi]
MSAAAASMMTCGAVRSQPAKRLRLLAAGPAGGAVDVAARMVGDQLRAAGYLAIVENHAGAAGQLGVEALLRSPADGGTVLVTPPGVFTIAPHVNAGIGYRLADVSCLTTLCGYQFAFAVGPAAKARTMADFLAWAKKHPAEASYGTPGAGTEPHFIGAEIERLSGAPLIHVPYRGGAQAMNDLSGGHLPAVISALPNLVTPYKAGKAQVLMMTGSQRSAFMPDVPTVSECGFPELASNLFYGAYTQAGVPAPVRAALTEAIIAACKVPAYEEGLRRMSLDPLTLSSAELDASMQAMDAKWAAVIKRTGFTLEK